MAAVAVALRCHPNDLRSMTVDMFNRVVAELERGRDG